VDDTVPLWWRYILNGLAEYSEVKAIETERGTIWQYSYTFPEPVTPDHITIVPIRRKHTTRKRRSLKSFNRMPGWLRRQIRREVFTRGDYWYRIEAIDSKGKALPL
jgi:hypothetical protein